MKKRTIGFFAVLLTASMLTGCGSGDLYSNATNAVGGGYYADSYGGYYEESDSGPAKEAYVTGSSFRGESGESAKMLDESASTNRKLIRNVSLEVETKEYNSMMATIEEQVQSYGGYIETMDSFNGSRYTGYRQSKRASLTIRIPQNKLDDFLATVSGVCNVIRRNDSVNDVTLTYVDTASKKDSLEVQQERLLAMMEQCETLEDMLILEERLTDVRYQIESLERQLRSIDNKVSYSTVSLDITEVEELTQVVEEKPTNWERIKTGFKDTLEDVIDTLTEICIALIINIPRLFVWAVVLFSAFMVYKLVTKKKEKTEKKAAQKKLTEEKKPTEEKNDK